MTSLKDVCDGGEESYGYAVLKEIIENSHIKLFKMLWDMHLQNSASSTKLM